jgi:hypothetical protein
MIATGDSDEFGARNGLLQRLAGAGKIFGADDDEHLGVDHREFTRGEGASFGLERGGQRFGIVPGTMGVLGELSREIGVSGVPTADGVDENAAIVLDPTHQSVPPDPAQHETAKRSRPLTGHAKESQSSERETDRIDWFVVEMFDDGAREVDVVLRVRRTRSRSVPQEIDADWFGTEFSEKYVETGALPGALERASPSVDQENRRTNRSPHESSN